MRALSIRLILTGLFLALLPSQTVFASTTVLKPFTVLVEDDLGNNATSSALGKTFSVRVFLLDPNALGAPGIDKKAVMTFAPNDSKSMPIVSEVVLRGGATMTTGSASGAAFYGESTITPQSSGTLTVEFMGDADYPRQSDSRPIDLWTPQKRSSTDQRDQLSGYQVHAIYVVPSDAVDNSRDTSGQISTWLMQGARWLDREAGDHWQYDLYNNVADVTFYKSSYDSTFLRNTDNRVAQSLIKEMGKRLPVGTNRKTYIFFIESANLTINSDDPDYADGSLCGLADAVMSHLVILSTGQQGSNCAGYHDTMDWPAAVAIHETIHTMGIEHVNTAADLMLKIPDGSPTLRLDSSRTQYYGGSLAGRDISKLPIWSKDPSAKLYWPCSYDRDTKTYYCKTNTQDLTDAYNANCWQKANPTLVFQVKSGSKWVSVKKPLYASSVKELSVGCNATYSISYKMNLYSASPGTYTYRFVAKGWTGKTFTVLYQN